MLWNDIYLVGTGMYLPKMVSVEEAIATGRYDAHSASFTDHLSVTVAAAEDNIADMAVKAGQQALARSGYTPQDVGAVFYSVVFHSGIDVWNGAGYIQNGVAAAGCFAAEVRAGSNGGLMALDVAASYLTAHPEAKVAVATAGDLWCDPYFDRWRADRMLYGDGAAAIAVSRTGGFARLLALTTVTDPSLEALHRGNLAWGPGNFSAENPINLQQRHDEFIALSNKEEVWSRLQAGARTAVDQALEETGLTPADIDHVVLPHFGRALVTKQCLDCMGTEDLTKTTWEFARQVGHLGPGDQFAGLNYLTEIGALKPGQIVFVFGVGGGFTWSVALLEILHEPAWASTAT